MSKPLDDYTAQVRRLKEGQTMSRAERVSLTNTDTTALKRALNRLRNNLNQSASRARETTGRGYRVESGHFVTSDGTAVVAVAIVTCMEDEGEDDI